jgi:SAM-dependent methyltransferase
MSEWTQDHTAALEYPTTYFAELNPALLAPMLANKQLQAPARVVHACELGYGTGLSAVIHASASAVQWWGTDYNPAHAQFAATLAEQAGVLTHLADQSFEEFFQRPDLPDFDFIALHGVWSWVSDANRTLLVDFLHRKLRPGGVVYLSYNTLPGHAQMLPVRNLMKCYLDHLTPQGLDEVQRAQTAYQFVQTLMDANPQLCAVHPLAKRTMDDLLQRQTSSYLNHEYLVQHWTPMSFCQVFDALQPAKLKFACSATPVHHTDAHFLIDSQRALLASIAHFSTRETTRDFLVNRQFRQDYWVKGGLPLSPARAQEALLQTRVVLIQTPAQASASVAQAVFQNTIAQPLFGVLVDTLAQGGVQTIATLVAAAVQHGIAQAEAVQAVIQLIGNGSVAVAQDEATIAQVSPRVMRLNAAMCAQARHSPNIGYLASAVTGGGVPVGQLQQQFLAYRNEGLAHAPDWTSAMAQQLISAGLQLIKNGALLAPGDATHAHLLELATQFETTELPLLKRLGCVL